MKDKCSEMLDIPFTSYCTVFLGKQGCKDAPLNLEVLSRSLKNIVLNYVKTSLTLFAMKFNVLFKPFSFLMNRILIFSTCTMLFGL